MRFGMGVPAWLGAILIVAPPAVVAGLVTGLLQDYVPLWVQPFLGFICLLIAGGAWLMAIMWWEKRRDDK
jgi:hypothetical protein